MTKLDEILKANGYTEIATERTNDGYVYKSMGVSGQDEWYVRFKDPVDNYLNFGVYDKYTPNAQFGMAGTFGNGIYPRTSLTWNKAATQNRHNVDYVININANRIIIFLQGMITETSWCGGVTYIGLPTRYDPTDLGSSFAGVATNHRSESATDAWLCLKNRKGTANYEYNWDYYQPTKSLGWNNQFFFSPLYIGSTDEGPRGQLDALFIMKPPNETWEVRHLDRFVKNGKNYMIINGNQPKYNSTSNLPDDQFFVMEV